MYTLLHALYQWIVIVVMHQYVSKSIKDINIIIELHYYHHVHTGSGTHIPKLLYCMTVEDTMILYMNV